jgi:hypothetical protein
MIIPAGWLRNQKHITLIISNDTIMKPRYDINADILHLISEISTKLKTMNNITAHWSSPINQENQLPSLNTC